jgi:hypothetical protein
MSADRGMNILSGQPVVLRAENELAERYPSLFLRRAEGEEGAMAASVAADGAGCAGGVGSAAIVHGLAQRTAGVGKRLGPRAHLRAGSAEVEEDRAVRETATLAEIAGS